jgi:DNA-binding NarL/FixJ family response regulator
MDAEPVRVLLADDHGPTREDVRMALEREDRFRVVADVPDGFAAIEAAVRLRPDVCLLDVHMPGGGVAATWEIAARLPQTKIVMLTVSGDEADLFAALRAGAAGYLLKDMDPRRLPYALDDVLRGEGAMPRRLVAGLIREFRDRSPRRRTVVGEGPEAQLTSREWQVLDLLRRRLSTAAIARRLVLSPVTVRSHINSIQRKLGVTDRDALLRRFEDER